MDPFEHFAGDTILNKARCYTPPRIMFNLDILRHLEVLLIPIHPDKPIQYQGGKPRTSQIVCCADNR